MHLELCPFLILCALAAPARAGDGQLPPSVELRARTDAIADSIGLRAVQDGLPDSASHALIGGARSYEARFDALGVTFVPALGSRAPMDQSLCFEAFAVERGGASLALEPVAPKAAGLVAIYERAAGVTERYRITRAGMLQSFTIDAPLGTAGDLVVRGRLRGALGSGASAVTATPDGGLAFDCVGGVGGGVHVGALTGIDTNGRTVAGWLSMGADGDELRLTLPASFVDSAAWPIVLDPLFGTRFDVTAESWDDSEPDVAFDASTNRYLVVWKRTFSASSSLVRGQMLDTNGALQGATIFFAGAGVASGPHVANVNQPSRFAVAWKLVTGSAESIQAQACTPPSGATSSVQIVAAGALGALSNPDVGGELQKTGFKQFVVVWDQNGTGIRGAKYELDPTGDPLFVKTFTIASDIVGFASHASPSIARSASYAGLYGVAYLRKAGFLGGTWDTTAAVIDRDGNLVNPGADLTTNGFDEGPPDIDGGGIGSGQWVVTSMLPNTSGTGTVTATPVAAGPSTATVGQFVFVSFNASGLEPVVGSFLGKAYVVWEEDGLLFDSLKMVGLDPATCMTCESALNLNAILPPGAPSLAICMNSSTGNPYDPFGLVVWNQESAAATTEQDVVAQLVQAYVSTGTAVNVGGGCGLGGTIAAPWSPAVGNGFFRIELSGADPSSPLAILNVNAPVATLGCGACQWLPFLLDFTLPVVAGNAGLTVPIPCNPSYVGAVLDAQWTVITPSSSPCPVYPQVSLSDRLRLTLGL